MEKQFTHHGSTYPTAYLLSQGCPMCRGACSVGHGYNILRHFSPLSNPPPHSSCFSKALRSKNPLGAALPISSNRRQTPAQSTLCLSGPQLPLGWAEGALTCQGVSTLAKDSLPRITLRWHGGNAGGRSQACWLAGKKVDPSATHPKEGLTWVKRGMCGLRKHLQQSCRARTFWVCSSTNQSHKSPEQSSVMSVSARRQLFK